MNWKIVGGVAALVLVVVLVAGMGGSKSAPLPKESAPVVTAPTNVTATPSSGDPVADVDAILSGEANGDATLLVDADQDSALVTSDGAALSDMTNAYDATQY
jgi:hypothetical protein